MSYISQNKNKTGKKHAKKKCISSDVLQALREGEHSAYEEVYSHHVSSVKEFLIMLTRSVEISKEITQEVFITLWEKRENIDSEKNISGYLYIIAKNFALKHFKRNNIILGKDFPVKEDVLLDSAPDEILVAKEKEVITEIAIKRMPAQRRRVYKLSREEGLTNREIAERLNISKNTVENHITSALKDIRNVIALFLLLILLE